MVATFRIRLSVCVMMTTHVLVTIEMGEHKQTSMHTHDVCWESVCGQKTKNMSKYEYRCEECHTIQLTCQDAVLCHAECSTALCVVFLVQVRVVTHSTPHRAKSSVVRAVRVCKDWPKWTDITHNTKNNSPNPTLPFPYRILHCSLFLISF